jgi:hypothetical protein
VGGVNATVTSLLQSARAANNRSVCQEAIADLIKAMETLNTVDAATLDPKSLTLDDLKDQVNEEYERCSGRLSVPPAALSDQLSSWVIGDFEIRRRK